METSAEIAHALLELPDAGFFAVNSTALTQIEWKLASRNFPGLAVSAPREIQIKQREALPLLLATQFNAVRDWEIPIADNLALVLFDHETATVTVAKPFEERTENRPDPGPPPAKSPKPTGDAATGIATSVRPVDIRKLFSLEWRPRRLSLMALSFDVVSNEADVSLIGEGAPSRPATRGIAPPPNADGAGFPSYDPVTVKVRPVGQGVTFTVAFQSLRTCMVQGALATTAQERHLPQNSASIGAHRVAAIVPVTFVVTRKDWRVPWTIEWGIPVFGASDVAVGAPISAVFAIPLPEEKLQLMPAGDYAAYVMMEGRVHGPQRFTKPAPTR